VLPQPAAPGVATVFLRQFASPFIYILLVAAGLAVVLGEWSDAVFIGVVVTLNAVIGTLQEARAERSALALRQMMTTSARVVRDGDVVEVDASAIVPGDVVLLASGDKVPADVRLLDSQDLRVDESLLTGEAAAVAKNAAETLSDEVGLADRVNMAFAGTLVTRGRGDGAVVSTGLATEIGALASELATLQAAEPPLLMRMRRFTHWVAAVMVVVAAVFAVIETARGSSLNEVALVAIALAVSAIPEGLPVALTVALALAMRKMAGRHVIVRRMAAVESLGSCTTIASDKTGTLTVNELTVTDVVLPGGSRWAVSGAGTVPFGDVTPVEAPDVSRRDQVANLARAGALCNEAVLAREDSGWTHHGDAVDVGLLVFAHKLGITRPEAIARFPLLDGIPFEPERRFAASLHQTSDSDTADLYVKGAVETVLAMCTRQLGPHGRQPLAHDEVLDVAEQLAADGRKVIAVASRSTPGGAGRHLEDRPPRDLVLLGLVAMLDPPRPGAREAVEACAAAGLRVLMVTGDHPSTALAIARQVGIAAGPGEVVTGHDLRVAVQSGSPAEPFRNLDALVSGATVFARVEPAQKLAIVDSLIRRGELVAVTGDGANDAPALRQAHVGVAMGRGGTDVAREAADLIVTDDNFVSIVAGIEEGRIAYGNVRKVISLLVSTGAGELVLFLLALSAGMPPPLTAVQLLWLNLVTNGIQDVALAFEPAEGHEMRRPPRPPSEGVFNRLMLERIAVTASIVGGAAFGMYRVLLDAGWTTSASRNAVMVLMVLFENVMVLNSRSETQSFLRTGFKGNRLLIAGTLAALGIHLTAMHWAPTQHLLQIAPLPANTWGWTVLTATALFLAVEAHKAIRRLRRRQRTPTQRGG